jgi:hypothetical protein
MWFSNWEKPGKPASPWTVHWPAENPTFQRVPADPVSQKILRSDKTEQGKWSDPADAQWQVFLIEWFPGRLASYFANRHRPEICMTMAGYEMASEPDNRILTIHGIQIPFKRYLFQNGGANVTVYHCVWQAKAGSPHPIPLPSDGRGRPETLTPSLSRPTGEGDGELPTAYDLFRGRRVPVNDLGRQVIEVALTGIMDPDEAEAALIRQLEGLLGAR